MPTRWRWSPCGAPETPLVVRPRCVRGRVVGWRHVRAGRTSGLRDLRPDGVARGGRVRRSPTSPTTGRSTTGRCGSRSTGPRCATRSGPHTVDELYRALDHARHQPDVGCVLLTGNGPSPRDGGWAFCSGGDQRIRGRAGYQYAEGETRRHGRPGPGRPAAHPGVPAADPVHAEGRHLRRPRLGRRRRALAARGVRPDAGHAPSTRGSSRPTPTSAASTAGSARPTSPARSGRSSPGRSSSSATSTTPTTAHRMGMVNARRTSCRPRARPRWSGRARSTASRRPRSGC